jgi:ABC-type transporter MlaC component
MSFKLSVFLFAGLISWTATSYADDASGDAFGVDHPAAAATRQILGNLSSIVNSNMGNDQQFQALCKFAKSDVLTSSIATQILGQYGKLQRDQAGVKKFRSLFPSILVNKLYVNLDKARGASFNVAGGAKARNASTFEVPTTMNKGGQSYNVTIVVYKSGGSWALLDGSAYGYSAVGYLKKDVQQKMKDAYDRDPQNSLPVTEYLNEETGGGFKACN